MYRCHLVVLLLMTIASTCAGQDESREPPQEFTLIVDGKPYPIAIGKELQLEGTLMKPTIELEASATRKFSRGGLEFQYPAGYSWEARLEKQNLKTWILTGNDITILYFVVDDEPFSPKIYAEGFREQMADPDVKIMPHRMKFGKNELTGKRMEFSVGGITLHQDAYELPTIGSKSRLLVIQTPAESEDNDECRTTMKLLTESMVIETQPKEAE